MMRKKKTAKEVVEEVVAKVNADLTAEVAAPKKEETNNHYYLCNVTLSNGKSCNCSAFM